MKLKHIRVAYSKGGIDWEHWRQGGSLGPILGSVLIEVRADATREEIRATAHAAIAIAKASKGAMT